MRDALKYIYSRHLQVIKKNVILVWFGDMIKNGIIIKLQ